MTVLNEAVYPRRRCNDNVHDAGMHYNYTSFSLLLPHALTNLSTMLQLQSASSSDTSGSMDASSPRSRVACLQGCIAEAVILSANYSSFVLAEFTDLLDQVGGIGGHAIWYMKVDGPDPSICGCRDRGQSRLMSLVIADHEP